MTTGTVPETLTDKEKTISRRNKPIRTVVVDLTPVLPGGDNGGAKVFVLELLRRLAERAPQTQFVLLTQAAAHAELATLDAPNMRRVVTLDHQNPPVLRSFGRRLSSRLLKGLPARPKRLAQHALNRLRPMLRRYSPQVIRNRQADLLFCPFTAPTYFEIGIPTVSVIYDLQYKTYPEFFSDIDLYHRDRTFVDATKRATMLVAISDYSRNAAIEHGRLDPDQIRTVHLHISQHSLRNAVHDETILPSLGLTSGQYLIYPANFWKHKNHEMLLTAFGIARSGDLGDEIKLVCTGSPGPRQHWLKRAADELGLGRHVLFPGYLGTAELLALIINSAGVIFPSLYEGFGLPVIEAMATGVPVACSNVTSLPEVAGDAAILFNPRVPGDIACAMVSLAHDKALTSRMIASGDMRATQFSNSTLMAEHYWAIFEEAVERENPSNLLVGVHPDGWVGPQLRLQMKSATNDRHLEMDVTLPAWVPMAKVVVTVVQHGDIVLETSIARGSAPTLSIPLPRTSGAILIDLSPSFSPADAGVGADSRELSVLLGKCTMVSADGNAIILFPEAPPA